MPLFGLMQKYFLETEKTSQHLSAPQHCYAINKGANTLPFTEGLYSAIEQSWDNDGSTVDSVSLYRTEGLINLVEGKYADLRF